MDLKAKLIDISTGDAPVVLITRQAALTYDLHTADRVLLSANDRKVIAAVNTTDHGFGLRDDQIGIYIETALEIDIIEAAPVTITPVSKPESIKYIKKKMDGKELSDEEMRQIVKDIVGRNITQVELTYFVAACSIYPLSFGEIVTLTRCMSDTGVQLHFDKPMVIDKHCIGGVPGNRTSMITVPILMSLGYTVPKTSSRAITSPAGTADTMEVFAEVNLSVDRMKQVVDSVGGCLVWGGSVNLAPADDRIIRVERPLSIDVPGLMISSVMAKKFSVGGTHVVIDIPFGPGAKVETVEHAEQLRRQFVTIGKMLGIRVLVIISNGSQPIGYGIGPLLEAYDVLAVLKNDPSAPHDLREKSLMIAGKFLEFIGHAPRGGGRKIAEAELTSGRAYKKFQEIIDAQGRRELPPLARFKHEVFATAAGIVRAIDNRSVAKVARIAGAPISKSAGILLYTKVGSSVEVGDKLFAVYADNEEKLSTAVSFVATNNPFTLG